MSLLRTICARGSWASSPINPLCPKNLFAPRRSIVMKASAAVAPSKSVPFQERNAKLGRPLSPHLSIYKPPLPMIMSISHRITGMALTAYVVGLSGASLAGVDVATLLNSSNIPGSVGVLVKFVVAFPFAYHLFNGIRHLIWDYGLALTIKDVYLTGYVCLALTALLALYLSSITTEKKKA